MSTGSAQLSSEQGLWLRRFGGVVSRDTEVRLICFPHAGGAASFFRPVARALSPRVDVLAVQYPGRQDRRAEAPVRSIGELANRIAAVLTEPLGSELPTAFFGHSMGAVTAYEVARRLDRVKGMGEASPFRLFVSGRRAPSIERDEAVHLRDDAGLIAEVASLGGTDSMVLSDPELRAMVLPALKADYLAIETYRYSRAAGEPAPCPVTVLIGDTDPHTTPAEGRAWSSHASAGDCELLELTGGHFFLVDRSVEVLDLLRSRLLPRTGRPR
ncbi:alpha/beta fold hydrolase [Streptomyces sp. NPDC095817]|uniref:thioesterase II family protein n=1 Tax=Streptomyces sp. NPDC095817 TaxID=3155082 RepID=UPI0033338516